MFIDRNEAGEKLALTLLEDPLLQVTDRHELLVLSIPTGGVLIGATVAEFLECPHQVVVVKKIGVSGYPDLAVGVVTEGSMITLNKDVLSRLRHKGSYLAQAIERAKINVQTHIEQFREGRALDLHAKVVILVDDGIASGETMKAALRWVTSGARYDKPRQVIVAVPVCAPQAATDIDKFADKFVCLAIPKMFQTIGQFYINFSVVDETEVIQRLHATVPSVV